MTIMPRRETMGIRFSVSAVMAACLLLVATHYTGAQNNSPSNPVQIGNRLELFTDDYLIEYTRGGAHRVLHHPVARDIVIIHDEPWEGSGSGYHTIFKDGDIYRMYYKAWQLSVDENGLSLPHKLYACYAESDDGRFWVKPNLGLYEFNGSTHNNIIWEGNGAHDFTPFLDTNPACPPDERYKAVGNGDRKLWAFVSPDGIHWRLLGDGPVDLAGAFDSQNLAFWDSVRGEYRLYFRDFREGKRDIKTAVSADFHNWSEPVWLEYPGSRVTQLYTNQIKPYTRAPHIFIGFPSRYVERVWTVQMKQLPGYEHRVLRRNAQERYGAAVTDALLMTSRDGVTFTRWDEAFLRPGLWEDGNWAYGDNYIAWHMIETPSHIDGAPGELSLFASERYWTGNSNSLRRFTLRIDGFVSVNAPLSGGEIVTRPLTFTGRNMVLNMATSAAGTILVEIQRPDGTPVDGYALEDCDELFGDDLERIVSWRGNSDTSSISGEVVRIRFSLSDADLYSYWFTE